MSTASETVGPVPSWPWKLWIRQATAVMRLELRKNLLAGRSLFLYLLAAAPVALLSIRLLVPVPPEVIQDLGGSSVLFAIQFRTFVLRFVVYFGSVWLFINLFRGDILEKTLHYYLLVPARREIILAGKYATGLLIGFLLFGGSTLLCYLLMFAPGGAHALQEHLLSGPGLSHLSAYLGVIALACVGYGAVFVLMGLLFRNPVIPAVLVLGWESINFLLPPVLKKLSVIYYLESLCPVPIPAGPLTILASPASPWLAVPGIVLLSAALLYLAALKMRQIEIQYGEE